MDKVSRKRMGRERDEVRKRFNLNGTWAGVVSGANRFQNSYVVSRDVFLRRGSPFVSLRLFFGPILNKFQFRKKRFKTVISLRFPSD